MMMLRPRTITIQIRRRRKRIQWTKHNWRKLINFKTASYFLLRLTFVFLSGLFLSSIYVIRRTTENQQKKTFLNEQTMHTNGIRFDSLTLCHSTDLIRMSLAFYLIWRLVRINSLPRRTVMWRCVSRWSHRHTHTHTFDRRPTLRAFVYFYRFRPNGCHVSHSPGSG